MIKCLDLYITPLYCQPHVPDVNAILQPTAPAQKSWHLSGAAATARQVTHVAASQQP